MISKLKRLIFKFLSFESYLRLHQRCFLLLYKTNFLKLNDNYSYHYFVKNLIKKGDIVLDIGANLGYYSFIFAKCVGKSGKVYAVEPIQIFNKIYNEIAKKHDNIILYPYALGAEEKSIKMVSSPNTGYFRTGLPHVYDSQTDGDINDAEFSFEAQMKIPSKLFDSLDRIDYIKCDIEGFEYFVISNMKDIISHHKPTVQVEIWKKNEEKVIELFKKMEYVPYKLIKNKLLPIIDSTKSAVDGDFIFIHSSNKLEI